MKAVHCTKILTQIQTHSDNKIGKLENALKTINYIITTRSAGSQDDGTVQRGGLTSLRVGES